MWILPGLKTLSAFVYYLFGDYLSGILIGVLTALGVRLFVSPGWNMVLAMMVGVGVGIVIHLLVGVVMMPFFGGFEVMIPGVVIGMFGGMLFGMWYSMMNAYVSSPTAIKVGALFGIVVVTAIRLYNRKLKGVVFEAEESEIEG